MINLVENASKKLARHCRIDIYNINNKIYFGEFTFFCGAFLHTFLCNTILGVIWQFNPDNPLIKVDLNYIGQNTKKSTGRLYGN